MCVCVLMVHSRAVTAAETAESKLKDYATVTFFKNVFHKSKSINIKRT